MPEISDFANLGGMDPLARDSALINQLSEYAGMPPSRMAAEIGVAVTTLTRPANSKASTRLGRGTLEKLRARWPDFTGWPDDMPGTPEPPSNALPFKMEGASEERMRRDLPIYGTALGADQIVDGEAIEQTTLNRAEILEYKRRPTILDGRADVYGLIVQGSSMEPVHRDGATVFVEGRKRPAVGDDAVVYLRGPDGDGGEVIERVLIKRVVRKTASYVELEQFTPAKIFKMPMERVDHMDRVLTLDDMIS